MTTPAARERISLERYQALVLDTQGSEPLVLQGAEPLLPHFRFIKTYHAFKLRERTDVSKGTVPPSKAGAGKILRTQETEGQVLQRVMSDRMGLKNILAMNDEGHRCFRAKPQEPDEEDLKGDERKEAEKNNETGRLWISGLEAVNRKLGFKGR